MPASIVFNHFPQIVWRTGEKYLWNPFLRKKFKNRPEERVRLQVVEYLLDMGWSKHRMSAEEGVASSQKGNLRTDLICYTQDFKPFLLVECKSNEVNISNQTADQIAIYNKQVKAEYLLMTNGLSDFWYSFNTQQKPQLLNEIPILLQPKTAPVHKNFEYWTARGFAGTGAGAELRKWLEQILSKLYFNSESVHYLSFKKKIYELNLNHYYRLFAFGKSRIALSYLATAFGDSRLIAIHNKNGENKAVMEINLDLLFKNEVPNASLYNTESKQNIDVEKELNFSIENFEMDIFTEKLFDFFES